MAKEPPPDIVGDYDAIEAAVLETARGRWFLAEFAERHRFAETERLLGAIGRLERSIEGPRSEQTDEHLQADLLAMLADIRAARTQVAFIAERADEGAALDRGRHGRVLATSEAASLTILDAAEALQDAAWTLRTEGVNPRTCDNLDRRITQILAACEFFEQTAGRREALTRALDSLEERLGGVASRFGLSLPAPAAPSRAVESQPAETDIIFVPAAGESSRRDVRDTVQEEPMIEQPARPAASILPPGPACADLPPVRVRSLADIDALAALDRLRLFT